MNTAIAYKYADPTEGARWIYDEAEAQEIAAEDPSLIVRVGPTASRAYQIGYVHGRTSGVNGYAPGTRRKGTRNWVDYQAGFDAGVRDRHVYGDPARGFAGAYEGGAA
jgi:hypothetical protein